MAEGDGDSEAKGGGFGMSAGPKGKLVQDIMSEMKEDEAAAKQAKEEEDKKGGGGIRMGNRLKKSSARMKGGARLSAEEMHRLRQKIQVLCQATNPLGKCMDYVHDDMEMMNKELEQWKGEYRRKTSSMESESKATEESLQPLQMKLLELEEQVKEQVQKINSVKASISKNDVRIQQLLRMVV